MTDTKLLFSKKAAAEMLDLSVRTVDYLLAGGELEYRRVGRKVLIPSSALTRFAGRDHAVEKNRRAGKQLRRITGEAKSEPTCMLGIEGGQ